jgi:hypothetical protein
MRALKGDDLISNCQAVNLYLPIGRANARALKEAIRAALAGICSIKALCGRGGSLGCWYIGGCDDVDDAGVRGGYSNAGNGN